MVTLQLQEKAIIAIINKHNLNNKYELLRHIALIGPQEGAIKPLLRFLSKIQFVLLLFTKAVRLELCGKKSELYLFTNVQGLPMMNSKAVFLTRQLF